MFSHDLILLGEKRKTGHDQDDNPIFEQTEREVLCNLLSVTRSEFYEAAKADLRIVHTVRINPVEYEGEQQARLFGKTYDIVRTYGPVNIDGYDLLELQLGEKVGLHGG